MNPSLIQEWPERAQLHEPERDTVRVVYDSPLPKMRPVIDDPVVDDGVRLDTYEARRFRTVDDLTADLVDAIEAATRARRGMTSINYHPEALVKIDEMIAVGLSARDLIDLFEEGR